MDHLELIRNPPLHDLWAQYGEAAKTAVGFFWKAGWAFVLGYAMSGMIQAFVPKEKLTRYMGDANARSISLATAFGAASSSCSFAALAAARSLVLKGAHFVAAVAFMFASTNLVIELGILILIFLGWQFLAAEIVGGLVLIVISSLLIRLTYPTSWMRQARRKVESDAEAEEEAFDWKERLRSRYGWHLVGHKFVSDWKMVWEEIAIGFTVAGFVAIFVPGDWFARVFLIDLAGSLPDWVVTLENAAVAPFVAAATFIGSMGNIPLATVLNGNGVLFAGIMAFIFSDLMVPPLVSINAKYYGWRIALYIAGVMYASIVVTALLLAGIFATFSITPRSGREVEEVTRFALDYTFWLNLVTVLVAILLVRFHGEHVREHAPEKPGNGEISFNLKRAAAVGALLLVGGGLVASVITR